MGRDSSAEEYVLTEEEREGEKNERDRQMIGEWSFQIL